MPDAAELKKALEAKFPFLIGAAPGPVVVQREKRLYAEVPQDKFREVLEHAIKDLGFTHLCTITGMDDKESLAALYHLAHQDGTLFNLRTRVPKDKPVMQSVNDLFPGSANYERELKDLLGFDIKGVPPGKRYPLTDDFPTDQHPLRKDWPTQAAEAVPAIPAAVK
jgi:NADH-quinone oxidoreductase subunit C